MNRAVTFLMDIITPSTCIGCSRPVTYGVCNICPDCASDIEVVSEKCPLCSGILSNGRCEICSNRTLYLAGNIVLFEYRGIGKELMHNLKFNNKRRLINFIVPIAVEHIRDKNWHIDIISSVPMSRKKKWARGYNQSELIARGISRDIGVPFREILSEKRNKKNQKELGLRNRFLNAINRFTVKSNAGIAGKNLLIVDDVFTTGATINECARVCRECGADNVYSFTIARTGIKF